MPRPIPVKRTSVSSKSRLVTGARARYALLPIEEKRAVAKQLRRGHLLESINGFAGWLGAAFVVGILATIVLVYAQQVYGIKLLTTGVVPTPVAANFISGLPAWAVSIPAEYQVKNIPWFPVNKNGKFRWDDKPSEIRYFTEEELAEPDRKFCEWLKNEGVTFEYLGTADAQIHKKVCRIAITVEAWGGEPASLSLAKKRTESGNGMSTSTSSAGALGLQQFMPGTFKTYQPWAKADPWDALTAFLAASNMDRDDAVKIEAAFLTNREKFVREFTCIPSYPGCRAWNQHLEQANSVWELAWMLQIARETFWYGGPYAK